MNKKRIAQYCCAALVAAGVGLNIQNAIADYGIGENSLSLVAVGGTNSGSNSNSNSDTTPGEPKSGWFCKMGAIKSSTSKELWISYSVLDNDFVKWKKIGGPNLKGEFKYEKTTFVHYFNCEPNKDSNLTLKECQKDCKDH